MLSPKVRHNIYKIIPFGIFWFAFSIIYAVLEKGILGDMKIYPPTGNPYDFGKALLYTPALALVMGSLIGAAEVLYFKNVFVQKSFSTKAFAKTSIYLGLIILFLVFITLTGNAIQLGSSVFDMTAWRNTTQFFFSYSVLSVMLYMAAIIFFSLFFHEVSESLGPMMLSNFFLGRYHHPVEEERIFVFVDMKSSTTIAEKLGHIVYFKMLREYFADLSPAIIDNQGEIYQYVGDEIVLTWRVGDTSSIANCLRCFSAMKDAMTQQSSKYLQRYGVVPDFKAGFHLGEVTTGEIGVIKKELIFTGDVLNTTARIMELCKTYHVDVLMSGQLVSRLQDYTVRFKSLGEIALRGRNERVELFTIV